MMIAVAIGSLIIGLLNYMNGDVQKGIFGVLCGIMWMLVALYFQQEKRQRG